MGSVGDVGIESTVGDMAKWDAALYTNRLLTQSSLDQMWTPVRLTGLQATGGPEGYRTGPRVGVAAAAEHPWRFWLPDEASVSAYRPGGRKRVAGTRQTGAP